jgi:valyl-tRNA synthetase
MQELSKAYDPKRVEDEWYRRWEAGKLFRGVVRKDREPYTIVIPPPNVTGILTMGHVLNNTIQDILVRWKRMQGYEACWIPGTDHAGIATQNAVEKALAKDGMRRHDLGREKFVERVWQWKEEYGGTIIKQLKKLGTSCDWDRERFTMDQGLSDAVKEVFVRMFDKGLIYRGKYIVNWCTNHQTALSDDEVSYAESNGNLWHIRYPIEGTNESAIVATTRPETMLGDTAVAVNPRDNRYKKLVGRFAILPLVGRRIPIIADDYVDETFGSGMVKVTPAHDPNDFLIGQRHNLEQVNILDERGFLNSNVPGQYAGLERFEGRKKVVKDLQDQGFLVKVDPYTHNVGKCYRCHTVIEPYLSDQWFVRMKPLAEPALRVVREGKIHFHPDRWEKVYDHWMTNIRDWCISRQIWWGHRIPVYYAPDGSSTAARSEEEARKKLGVGPGVALRQDEDVLDTWFSSWLWPFSTLGWPNESEDLRYFNPTSTLVTAPDIIFFWVARMIMANMEFLRGEPAFDGTPRIADDQLVPFRDVYFTSIIRDAKGRKMSKSLGNSPDPLDVIDQYGADALRFTVAFLSPLGQDVLFSSEKCELGRNFANKIWNAGRFLLMNKAELAGQDGELDVSRLTEDHLDLADRWILSRLHHATSNFNAALAEFHLNDASKVLYDFVWHDFCDWYVELVKTRFYGEEPSSVKKSVLVRALWIFDQALRLLHPMMPFVTEELWQHLADRRGESIMRAEFPRVDPRWIEQVTEDEMGFVQEVINAIRNIRGENNISPAKEIKVQVRLAENVDAAVLRSYDKYLKKLARVSTVELLTSSGNPKFASSAVVNGSEIFVPLEGLIDLEAEKTRVEKEVGRLQAAIEATERKLANKSFIERAPADIVEREREKLSSFKATVQKLKANLAHLQ